MELHSKAPLCCAFPFRCTTYTRTGGFRPGANPEFQRVARQNPPVLWLTESACSRPEQPLSTTHGRQRYNTLDFSSKVVCHETAGFIGFFLPLKGPALHWMPPTKAALPPLETTAKGTLSPLDSSANRALPAPIGLPKAKGTAIPLESHEAPGSHGAGAAGRLIAVRSQSVKGKASGVPPPLTLCALAHS